MATMQPTIPWMAHTFNEYNEKYFHGRLGTPKFSLRCAETNWGYFKPDGTADNFGRVRRLYSNGTIFLNGKYKREEKDWITTMLHEMIHMYIVNIDRKYPKNGHGREFQEWAAFLRQDGWDISEANEKKGTDAEATEQTTDDRAYEDRMIKPYIFCVISQPNDTKFKLWGFKAEYDNLNKYITTAKKLKPNGAVSIYIYYCYSAKMKNLQSSSNNLMGIGGNSFNEIIGNLTKILGERLTQDNFKLWKEMPL